MTGTALITGGQQGIGLGIAQALHGAGWRVALMSEREGDDQAVAEALALMPGAVHVTHDIAEIAGVAAALDKVEAAIGPVDTLVSNAGVPAMVRGDLLEMSVESFDRCMSVNLRGAFFLIQECTRRMCLRPLRPTGRSTSSPRSAPRSCRPTGRNTASPRPGPR
jgi:NAD(P)-dependent dehydrogenase (short-subunit alcohol dehydrogenase family)